jgi:hypothetical protein
MSGSRPATVTAPDERRQRPALRTRGPNGLSMDIQLRSWGIQLVDGRMPGLPILVRQSNAVAVKIAQLQRCNILTFLAGNVNGRSIIHQLMEDK